MPLPQSNTVACYSGSQTLSQPTQTSPFCLKQGPVVSYSWRILNDHGSCPNSLHKVQQGTKKHRLWKLWEMYANDKGRTGGACLWDIREYIIERTWHWATTLGISRSQEDEARWEKPLKPSNKENSKSLFDRQGEGERKGKRETKPSIFSPLVHYPNDHKSQGWLRLRPEAIQGIQVGGRAQVPELLSAVSQIHQQRAGLTVQ